MALAGFYSGVHDRKAAAVAWEQAAELSPKRPYAADDAAIGGAGTDPCR